MFARLSKPARPRKKKESPQKGVRSKTNGGGYRGCGYTRRMARGQVRASSPKVIVVVVVVVVEYYSF